MTGMAAALSTPGSPGTRPWWRASSWTPAPGRSPSPTTPTSTGRQKTVRLTFYSRQSIIKNLVFSAYVLLVEAQDENGNPGISQVARARLVITVEDVNDMPPLFKQRKYEGFMSSDLSRLRNNLQVEAVDLDKTGTVNSDVRYEIIAGNYEQKFSIDQNSGVISVVEPLQGLSNGRSERALEEIDPIITLQVRAYDLGHPSLDSQVPVNIFTQDVQSRYIWELLIT